jgi:hypothetical protein
MSGRSLCRVVSSCWLMIEQRHRCGEDLPDEIRRGLSSQHGGDSIVQGAVLDLCDFVEHWFRFDYDVARVAARRALAGECACLLLSSSSHLSLG